MNAMNSQMPKGLGFRASVANAKNEKAGELKDTTKASEDACMDGSQDCVRSCVGERGCLG